MMESLTPQEKDGLKAGAILALLLFGAAWWYDNKVVTPQIEQDKTQIASLQTELHDLENQLRDMDIAAANLEKLKAKQELLERIAQKLPNSIDPQGFYKVLEHILQATRIDYSELSQEDLLVRSVYTEIPYRIQNRARYHDFGQFLNLIEENPERFMRVKTFTIENQDVRPSVHPVTVEIATFMFNSKG